MELSIKSIVLLITLVLTGLSAGFFVAWSVSVIPGTQNISNQNYMETMQSINRAILNPRFYSIFFGSLIFLATTTILEYNADRTTFWLALGATLVYLVGTFGVTAAGNVPLNNQLDALNISELSSIKMGEFRQYYETKWNRLHLIRTLFSVVAFVLLILSVFTHIKSFK